MFAKRLLIGIAAATFATAAIAEMTNHDNELTAKKIGKVLIQTKTDVLNFMGTADVQITSSSGINIGNKTGFFVATFGGESNCSGDVGGYCSVKILCDGVEAAPAVGSDFAFDSVGSSSSTSNWHSLSVTRRSNPLTGGTHRCEVRTRQSTSGTIFWIDDWTFKVEFWQQ